MSHGDSRKKESDQLLQQWLSLNQDGNSKDIGPAPDDIGIPLSFGQQRIYFLQELNPKSPFYHYVERYSFSGKPDLERLIASFEKVVLKHEILRTTFPLTDGTPVQLVHAEPRIELNIIPTVMLSPESFDTLAREEANKPFDLQQGPLVRISVLKQTDFKFDLVLTLHHMITDQWSSMLMREEWARAYRGEELSTLPVQYRDFAYWQRNQTVFQQDLSYWKDKLSGELPLIKLLARSNRSGAVTFKGGLSEWKVSSEITKKLRVLCQQMDCTMFVLLLSVYKVLLYRYSGLSDLLVGAPVNNRDRTVLEKMIGFFNETLVFRTSIHGSLGFLQVLAEVRKTVIEGFQHKNVPFELLVQELQPERHPGTNPLFQVMFLYHRNSETPGFGDEIEITYRHMDLGISKFDLTFYVAESDHSLDLTLEYSTELFSKEAIENIQHHITNLINGVLEDPSVPIGKLPMLEKSEYHEIVNHWSSSGKYSLEETDIVSLITRHAVDSPGKIAVIAPDQQLTYGALHEKSEHFAKYLLHHGSKEVELIGLCTARTVEMLIGMLGIMKAGMAYIPIDPDYPEERINYMIENAAIDTVLVQKKLANKFASTGVDAMIYEDVEESKDTGSIDLPEIAQTSLAYVIYTSGSSAGPKGVKVTHRNLLHSTVSRHRYYQKQPGAFLLLSSYAFDSSVAGIYWTLSVGSTLILPDNKIEQDLEKLIGLIAKHRVTHILLLPSLYRLILSFGQTEKLQCLNTVIVAGEVCPVEVGLLHHEKLKECLLFNEYGPTEATVWCSVQPIKAQDNYPFVPIGRPLPNAPIYILDKDQQLVPPGVAGELYIGGEGVSAGYLNKPHLTEAKFVKDAFVRQPLAKMYKSGDLGTFNLDGTIDYLGRVDSQLKIRGFRIEPGEIENALNSYPGVKESLVISTTSLSNEGAFHQVGQENKGSRLIGYVSGSEDLTSAVVKDHLKAKLPTYMVPSVIVVVKKFPRLPNGKIAVKNLPEPASINTTQSTRIHPLNRTEEQLLEIWKEALKLETISTTDNFFELGGDSIISIHIVAKAREMGLHMSPDFLFEYQSIQELAKAIDNKQGDSGTKTDVVSVTSGDQNSFDDSGLSQEDLDRLYDQLSSDQDEQD